MTRGRRADKPPVEFVVLSLRTFRRDLYVRLLGLAHLRSMREERRVSMNHMLNETVAAGLDKLERLERIQRRRTRSR